MTSTFIIRGFGKKKDREGQEFDFDRVERELIRPAMDRCGLHGGTTATEEDAGNIREDMFALILKADVVICDITVHNANVFYELGIRHALRKKHTILLRGDGSKDVTPFDLSTDRYLAYDTANPGATVDKLESALRASLKTQRETDSPIFLLLPTLTEANPQDVTVLPLDFVDEVERAASAKDKAWLRVIAEDLRGRPFERDGLRVVARAQWALKDLDAAQANWETIVEGRADDVEAHLALANIYERQYRLLARETLLTSSNQSIAKVLASDRLDKKDRAEALALQARNAKTLWRERFDKDEITDPAEARRLAFDARAREAHKAYLAAFSCDLNKFYAGIAALQMAEVLRMLAGTPGWSNLFKGNKKEAQRAQEDLESERLPLSYVVEKSILRSLDQETGEDKMWADIAHADWLFLTQPDDEWKADPSAVVQAYTDAIPSPKDKPWAAEAAGGQLALFRKLGLRGELAAACLEALKFEPKSKKPVHLVVFTGHGIDAPGAPVRFPQAAEPKALELIEQRLAALQADAGDRESLVLLASGAPGADILAHDAARRLGIEARLCLPMPADDVSGLAFEGLDGWRARFLDLVSQMKEKRTLQMADHAKLPPWVEGRLDPWSRGNRWVLELAKTWGAPRVTVLALWDGVDNGRDGGTAQMVRLARKHGGFRFVHIESAALTAAASA